jgi:DNA primase
MDVIALDRAGISEAVAPNGTAVTDAQLERMWRLDPSPIMCFDGDSAGRKAAIRAATRALPHIRPDRTLRFVELPAGQDPDDVIRTGGREAFEALIAQPEPLDARLWRHETEAEPLATPEAWAGLKQRLIDHAASIGHPDLARMYREDWLSRFYDQRRPSAPTFAPQQRRGSFKQGRYVPPTAPVGEKTLLISGTGIDTRTARSLLVGFINFPDVLPEHAAELAALPIDDPKVLQARDELVDRAFSGAPLDREQLIPIFGTLGVASGIPSRSAVSFSFTRPDTPPDRARADLAATVETLAASEEIKVALHHATERCMADTSDEAFEEQQRLIAAHKRLQERLAQLAGTE